MQVLRIWGLGLRAPQSIENWGVRVEGLGSRPLAATDPRWATQGSSSPTAQLSLECPLGTHRTLSRPANACGNRSSVETRFPLSLELTEVPRSLRDVPISTFVSVDFCLGRRRVVRVRQPNCLWDVHSVPSELCHDLNSCDNS